MSEFINFKKYFIETYKVSDKSIEEIKKILSKSDINSSELNEIIEAIICYRNQSKKL